jgi:site-specific DNA-methyltransferase (cytosine-N(4)-specific)
MYKVIRNESYDFLGTSYSALYPNLHKYPATMLPQIGIKLFKDFDIQAKNLLDPYCGSGSSFTVGLDVGIKEMNGFDLNPLAVLISKVKFTMLDIETLLSLKDSLRNNIAIFIKDEKNIDKVEIPIFNNIDFWFSKNAITSLAVIKTFIEKIEDENYKRFFLLPFSEVARECSYTRNNEFKLYRMKEEDFLLFNPDIYELYFYKLQIALNIYQTYYLPKLNNMEKIEIENVSFYNKCKKWDVVLTSPPYGDSKTTVAYGQFSFFGNHWLGIKDARKIDNHLMGGVSTKNLYSKGIISNYILEIAKQSDKRALEVSSYYFDLQTSIKEVANAIAPLGYSIYVVGNRCVKGITLPTDQFIAEQFELNGLKHLVTYERLIGNKSMPLKNSPTNIQGKRMETMTKEYIVVCKKY